MQLEKELISLDHLSFNRIEDSLACVKELQLKLGECKKDFLKKNGQIIESIFDESNTSYDVLCSTFHTSWSSKLEDGKDYSFDSFYGLLIEAQLKLLDEGKLEVKQQFHLIKGKG
jgi:hypothetical protein